MVVDGGECDDATAFIQITIDPCEVLIPNVITPNGDGENDLLLLEAPVGGTYSITIHNRWGQEVWSKRGSAIAWNGTNDHSEPLPEGVYYYVFTRTTGTGDRSSAGFIQILRAR